MENKTMVNSIHNLEKEQLLRLYQLFDFNEEEEIVDAQLVCGKTLLIHYIDNRDNTIGTYMPTLEGKEGKDKINLIMNGVELSRKEDN